MRWKRPQHTWWLGGCLAGLLIAILAGGFSLPLVVVFVGIFGAGAALIALDEPAGETFAAEPDPVPYPEPPEQEGPEGPEGLGEPEGPEDEGSEQEGPEFPADPDLEELKSPEGPEDPKDEAPESPEAEAPKPATPSVRPSGDASPT